MLRRLYDWTLAKAAGPGAERWLAGISFADSSFFPVPPDVMQIPMSIARPERSLRYAVVSTVASVAGALLVGSPSWGGVIGMGETELVDGTTVSHPSYAVRMDSGAALENRGLRPTVHVEAAPHDAMRGRDALLEAAIAQANELVAASERADAARGAVSDTEWMPIMRPNLHWSSTMLLPNA